MNVHEACRQNDAAVFSTCCLSASVWTGFLLFFWLLASVIEPLPTLALDFFGPEQPDTQSFMYSQHNLIGEADLPVVIVQSLHNDTSFLFWASFVTAVSPWQNCQSLMLRSSPQGRKSCDLSGHPPLTWQRCAIIFPLAHWGWISLKWMSFCVGCTIERWQFSTLLASTWTHSLGCDLSLLLISNLGKTTACQLFWKCEKWSNQTQTMYSVDIVWKKRWIWSGYTGAFEVFISFFTVFLFMASCLRTVTDE